MVIHLHAEGFERAYQALTLALTAKAMGQDCAIVFAFGALRALAEDRLGDALPGPDRWSSQRAEHAGVSKIEKLLADARQLGVKLWACETVAKVTGVELEQLEGRVELVGLPQIVKAQQDGQLLYI